MRGLLIFLVILTALGCEAQPRPQTVYKFKIGQCVSFVAEENKTGVIDLCNGISRPYSVRYFDNLGQLQSGWFEEYELTEKQQ